MKTKLFLIVIALIGSSLLFAQEPDTNAKEECQKKVMKKIKRKMAFVNYKDYVPLGKEHKVILTCSANEENNVEIQEVWGRIPEFNQAIIQHLEEHPVKCENLTTGKPFSFVLTFRHEKI